MRIWRWASSQPRRRRRPPPPAAGSPIPATCSAPAASRRTRQVGRTDLEAVKVRLAASPARTTPGWRPPRGRVSAGRPCASARLTPARRRRGRQPAQPPSMRSIATATPRRSPSSSAIGARNSPTAGSTQMAQHQHPGRARTRRSAARRKARRAHARQPAARAGGPPAGGEWLRAGEARGGQGLGRRLARTLRTSAVAALPARGARPARMPGSRPPPDRQRARILPSLDDPLVLPNDSRARTGAPPCPPRTAFPPPPARPWWAGAPPVALPGAHARQPALAGRGACRQHRAPARRGRPAALRGRARGPLRRRRRRAAPGPAPAAHLGAVPPDRARPRAAAPRSPRSPRP